jgi:hypothetical protein
MSQYNEAPIRIKAGTSQVRQIRNRSFAAAISDTTGLWDMTSLAQDSGLALRPYLNLEGASLIVWYE